MLLVLLMAGCGEQEDTADTAFCLDAPVLTWDNFGDGFMTQHCQSCHASESPSRQDAPEDISFDTEEQTLALADRILARATGDSPTMPPQGGAQDVDRLKLQWWLSCP